MEKKKNSGLKTTRTERRKKFNKWIDMDFLHKQTGKVPIFLSSGETKITKIMSNLDRRTLGLEQDQDLEDYQL